MHLHIAGKLTGRVTKWIVFGAWIVIMVIASGFAQKLTDVQNNEASSWLPASAESTRALEKLAPFMDQNDIPTVVVYERDGGLTPEDLNAIQAQVSEIQAMDGVVGEVRGPDPSVPGTLSEDGEVAQTVVTYNFGKNGWNALPDVADELNQIIAIDGVTTYLSGAGGQAADSAEAFAGIDGTLLFAALGVVILILLFTYRSPVLWLLPILSAMFALFTSEALIYYLAKEFGLTVNGQSQSILTVLVIGAGTDYALLLVARYREELRRHEDRHEAMAFALHRAAPAIFASAATVVAGMLCLGLADMNSTAGLGPVNAIGVAITLVVMVTLLPALLVICGRWIFWPKRPTFGSPEPTSSGFWARVGQRIAPRPRAVWVTTAVILGVACLGMFRLDTGGLSTEESYTKEFQSITGQKTLEDHGLVDTSNPIQVVANADKQQDVADAMATVEGIGEPNTSVPPVGGVALITATVPGDVAAQSAYDKVEAVRDAVHQVDGADALVGGTSAIYLDIREASSRDNKVIIPVVLFVVMLILMVLLRALSGAVPADPDRDPVVRHGAGRLHDPVPHRLHQRVRGGFRLRALRRGVPALRVRVPGRAGHRLQHLPDDPRPRGDPYPRHPPRLVGGTVGHGRRDHLGGTRAGRDVRRARHAAAGVPGPAQHGRGTGRDHRHDDHPVGARDRAQPRPGRQDLVAEQARPRRTTRASCPSSSRKRPCPAEAPAG